VACISADMGRGPEVVLGRVAAVGATGAGEPAAVVDTVADRAMPIGIEEGMAAPPGAAFAVGDGLVGSANTERMAPATGPAPADCSNEMVSSRRPAAAVIKPCSAVTAGSRASRGKRARVRATTMAASSHVPATIATDASASSSRASSRP
jgi:hypothetical protein